VTLGDSHRFGSVTEKGKTKKSIKSTSYDKELTGINARPVEKYKVQKKRGQCLISNSIQKMKGSKHDCL
jgi:hypothetical protein